MKFNITLLPGDGIGPEVTHAAVKVLEHIADSIHIDIQLTEKPIGGKSIDKYGVPLTEDTLTACNNSDAIFLGAVGGYLAPVHSKHPFTDQPLGVADRENIAKH